MVTTVPLTPIVREILRGAEKSLTHHEVVERLLHVEIVLQPGELSSVLAKMLERGEIERELGPRVAVRGRREVWLYSWKESQSE